MKKTYQGLLLTLSLYSMGAIGAIQGPINVTGGTIEGKLSADKQLAIFQGIPYAAPPVGELRWKKPQSVTQWDGVKKTDAFAAGCMQKAVTGDKLPWSSEFLHQGPMSEDCLYLNIWSPAQSNKDKLPVIVFIHGGGFVEGSGSVPIYDGENLARKNVVFVNINYRLGVFGFLAHEELTKESGASGNYGLYDQIAALRWIKANIDKFGGDSNNVTIMGQSAGANSIVVLNASPLAHGLYHKAIMESAPGSTISNYGIRPAESLGTPLADAEKKVSQWAKSSGYSSLSDLRRAPAGELVDRYAVNTPIKGAVIDGALLPTRIAEIYQQNKQNDVPVLAGMNKDERGSEADYGKWSLSDLNAYTQKYYGENLDAFNALYRAQDSHAAAATQKNLLRDERLYAMQWMADLRVHYGSQPNYLYFFSKAIPWKEHPNYGVFHSSELPYVLHNQSKLNRQWDATDKSLENAMSSYWVNFAASGNPNGQGLPVWKSYSRSEKSVICLDKEIGMCDLLNKNKETLIAGKKETP
ncbi:carboxylesterase family protein [Brenneria populi subsp. brevivirga]|uniref:carboxylesterase/lipase family protein n=1 Tax=Brenneria populi TaxID=1505588 RepID=UPI002E19B62A|nr:carboxylesterase family protein [Brenneria populi subsp. brevivirga]